MNEPRVAVVLPALNERGAVEAVVRGFLDEGARVVVTDNGSTDETGAAARAAGADVVLETRRGYGAACLAGLAHLRLDPPAIVVFADCDGTLDPKEMGLLTAPLVRGEADLVLGVRARPERGALPARQRLGNRVACVLLRLLYGVRVRDVPPYRAARFDALDRLGLKEATFGLPIETVALAARRGLRVQEVEVSYRRRAAGESKVSGTLRSSLAAGLVMVSLCVRLRFRRLSA